MREKLEQVLKKIRLTTNQDVSLFAAFKMDDLTDKWSVLLAADWINQENKRELFSKVISLFSETLSLDELQTIARLGVFNSNDYMPKLLIEKYKTGDTINEDQKVNGNIIHEGFVLEVNNK